MTAATIEATPTRIYVASLTDYNAGRLHGVWITIDSTVDIDDVWSSINAMLAASPEARSFPEGGPAEEWAVHDHEGFGPLQLGEWPSIERVVAIAHAVDEADEPDALLAWLAHDESNNEPDGFSDAYAGSWESEDDFYREQAETFVLDELARGLDGVASYDGGDHLRRLWEQVENHIDEAAVGRSLCDGDYYLLATGGTVHAFRMDP